MEKAKKPLTYQQVLFFYFSQFSDIISDEVVDRFLEMVNITHIIGTNLFILIYIVFIGRFGDNKSKVFFRKHFQLQPLFQSLAIQTINLLFYRRKTIVENLRADVNRFWGLLLNNSLFNFASLNIFRNSIFTIE